MRPARCPSLVSWPTLLSRSHALAVSFVSRAHRRPSLAMVGTWWLARLARAVLRPLRRFLHFFCVLFSLHKRLAHLHASSHAFQPHASTRNAPSFHRAPSSHVHVFRTKRRRGSNRTRDLPVDRRVRTSVERKTNPDAARVLPWTDEDGGRTRDDGRRTSQRRKWR